MINKPVYLDHQATTPMDSRVFKATAPYYCDEFGNPGSSTHKYGERTEEAVKLARENVKNALGAVRSSEIIFTSGATESNNIALQGAAYTLRKQGKSHIISSMIEHKSVLGILEYLEGMDYEVTYLQPDPEGRIDPSQVERAITSKTGLISLMHANNEIGVITDVARIGEIAKDSGIWFHCDAAQSFGKIPLDVEAMNIHLLSVSAHKIYGPKGIGALYVRKQNPSVKLNPIMFGGGQEEGLRPGTLAAPLIVGLGYAAKLACESMFEEDERISNLRDRLLAGLLKQCPDVHINGSMENRLGNNLNVSFLGVKSDTLMMNLWNDIAVSDGSACTSASWTSSYVLKAMGLSEERADSAIRFGLGRFTTDKDINFAVNQISEAVQILRTAHPVG